MPVTCQLYEVHFTSRLWGSASLLSGKVVSQAAALHSLELKYLPICYTQHFTCSCSIQPLRMPSAELLAEPHAAPGALRIVLQRSFRIVLAIAWPQINLGPDA